MQAHPDETTRPDGSPNPFVEYASMPEPTLLERGKVFHELFQQSWSATAKGGRISVEKVLRLSRARAGHKRGRYGRMDIVVDELGDFVSVAEIKSTDWDKVRPANMIKLLGSHRQQIW